MTNKLQKQIRYLTNSYLKEYLIDNGLQMTIRIKNYQKMS